MSRQQNDEPSIRYAIDDRTKTLQTHSALGALCFQTKSLLQKLLQVLTVNHVQ